MPQKVLYTIGHSNRTIEEFIGLLKAYGIKVLVDIRRFPTSKWEWFKRENLSAALEKERIQYVYLGKRLGGYRTGGYVAYMKTEEFRKGVRELLRIMKRGRTAVMCSERVPWKCHRWFLSSYLLEKGVKVIHIIDAKRTYVHRTLASELREWSAEEEAEEPRR